MSDPLESAIAGETRVILAVPIYNQQKEIIGVLGGSYDIGNLNKIVFKISMVEKVQRLLFLKMDD